MSTRSKTRSSLSSKASDSVNSAPKARGRTLTQDDDMDVDTHTLTGEGKENMQAVASKTTMGPPLRTTRKSKPRKARTRESLRTVDCICSKGDDGSPMVFCSQCQIWYHFTCVDISEPEAEEISVYVCPTCTTSTGSRSAMVWEGDQAFEECSDDESAILARRQVALKAHQAFPEHEIKQPIEESEESSSSEDEYTEDKKVNSPKDQRHGRLPRLSTVSDTGSVVEASKRRTNRVKQSASPSPSIHGPAKRKASFVHQSSSPPPSKKKRPRESHTSDDPVRKYCLTKLEELFKDVFLRYPHVRVSASSSDEPPPTGVESSEEQDRKIVAKKLEELSDEEKDALIKESQQFSQDLENCVFDIYSEPDKSGNPHASGKYKERFRMLQFNLSKVDRVIIHQRITSGTISPKEISLMSSTDLADEETKQHIKLAEKEALEHSILLKSTVPRAKITHKGLQDIEDVNGEVATSPEIELHKAREQEEEERRERERSARLRATQRQRTASISVPPESPTVQQSPTMGDQLWGGPPPVPAHAMSPTAADFASSGSRPPVFMHTPDLNTTELELNLADLINIDDEQDPSASASHSTLGSNIVSSPVDASSPTISSVAPTGISPFAARPERQRGASFDLNSLWNMTKDDSAQSTEPVPEPTPTAATEPSIAPVLTEEPGADGSDKDDAMELESVEANDQDFDMFLEEKETEQEQSEELIVTPIPPRNIDALPEVWTGKLTMPLDSSVPQETSLVARQIAGRPLPADSPLWKTLFPSEQLRIEGRVAVENSVKYLVGMRLNAAKELYAAAFVPSTLGHEQDFKTFCDFLIAKGRHGLVFPWGSRPKEYHPGRELYMIPLRQSEPLPEFVELLDELKLPKIRDRDCLLGVWILNKGKLAVLPGASQPPPVPTVSLPTQPQLQPQLQPQPQPQPSHTPPLNLSILNNLPPISTLNAARQGSGPPVPALPIARDALAAEVASLTPEQLQEVLRTLASTQLPPMPQPGPPPVLPQIHNIHGPPMHHVPTPPIGVPTPPMGNTPPMMSTPQSWMQAPPAPYANYPPPNVPFQQPPAHGVHGINTGMPAHFDRPDYERQKYDRDFQPGPNYQQGGSGMRGDHRGERGWRGNAGNRGGNQRNNSGGSMRGGRGRSNGEGSDFTARRDSGWPRRQRGEGHSGPSW